MPALTRVAKDVKWTIRTGTYQDGRWWVKITNPNHKTGQSILYERAGGQAHSSSIRQGEWYFRVSRGGGEDVVRVGTGRFY